MKPYGPSVMATVELCLINWRKHAWAITNAGLVCTWPAGGEEGWPGRGLSEKWSSRMAMQPPWLTPYFNNNNSNDNNNKSVFQINIMDQTGPSHGLGCLAAWSLHEEHWHQLVYLAILHRGQWAFRSQSRPCFLITKKYLKPTFFFFLICCIFIAKTDI